MSLEDQTSRFVRTAIAGLSLDASARILDAPCGFGRHAHWLASLGFRVTGADIDLNRLEKAAKAEQISQHKIAWRAVDLEQPWQLAEQFDVFLAVHYFSPHIIERAKEVLRPGGVFIYESFGGHGKNHLALPRQGAFGKELKRYFEEIELEERPVGPSRSAVAIKARAVRRDS